MGLPPTVTKARVAPPAQQQSSNKVAFAPIVKTNANRIVIYGPGGIGKTTIAFKLPGKTVFFDRDKSLGKLRVPASVMLAQAKNWKDVRSALQASGWDGVNNVVIDSGSELEKDCLNYILANIKTEKGGTATSIESYGWGKGWTIFYEQFLGLLSDLEIHFLAGRNVVVICHEDRANVPNPEGDDWMRYEPLLYQGKTVSLRAKMKNWADFVLFLGYDVAVEDGVGKGSGTRTIWTSERPHCMAKSRTTEELSPAIAIPDIDFNPWPEILK